MAGSTINVSILANAKDLQKALGQSESALSKFGKVAGAVAIAAGVALGALGVKAVKSASALEQAMGGLQSVFKDNTGQMEKWANGAASSVGLAKSEYANLATVLGAQLKNMGVSMDALGGQTNGLITLGADLAATFGGTTSDAVSALSALLRGERDPIERYGVSLKDADIKARMAEKGLSGLTGEALKNATAVTTLELLYEQTADAQGQFSRETDTLAGSQQRLSAGMENLSATFGTALLPAVTAVTGALGALVNGVSTSEWFTGLTASLTEGSNKFADFVFSILNGESVLAGLSFGDALQVAVNNVIGFISGPGLQGMADGFLAMRSAVTTAIYSLAEGVAANLPAIIATIGEVIVQLVTSIAEAAPYLLTAGIALITALAQGVLTTLPRVIESFVGLLPDLVSTVVGMLPALLAAGISLIMSLVTAVVTVIPMVITALVTAIPILIAGIVALIPQLLAGAVQLFTALVQAIPLILPPLLAAIITLLPLIISTLLNMIPTLLDSALSLFTAIVEAVPLIIPMLISGILDLLPKILTTVISMLPKLIDGALKLFLGIVEAIPKIVPQLIGGILKLLPTLLSSLIQMIPALINGAVQLFVGIVTAIPKIIPQLIGAIIGLLPVIISTVIQMVPQLISAGVQLIQGLIRGISQMAGAVGSALIGIAKNAIGGFLSFLGIKSPSRLFMKFGKNIDEGLAKGITGGARVVNKAMVGLSTLVSDSFAPSLSMPGLAMAGITPGGYSYSSSASTTPAAVNITVNAGVGDPAEIGREVVSAIRAYENAGGRL